MFLNEFWVVFVGIMIGVFIANTINGLTNNLPYRIGYKLGRKIQGMNFYKSNKIYLDKEIDKFFPQSVSQMTPKEIDEFLEKLL